MGPLSRSSLLDLNGASFDCLKIKGEEMAHRAQSSWDWLLCLGKTMSSWLGLGATNLASAGATPGSLVFTALWSPICPVFPAGPCLAG